MEIKQKFEFLVVKHEKFIIHKSPSSRPADCAECGEAMLTIAQAAVLFSVKQSRIFQIVEAGKAHYTEAAAGALMVCPTSLAKFLDCND